MVLEESVLIDITNQHTATELTDLNMMNQQSSTTSCGRGSRFKRPNADNLTDKLRLKPTQVRGYQPRERTKSIPIADSEGAGGILKGVRGFAHDIRIKPAGIQY